MPWNKPNQLNYIISPGLILPPEKAVKMNHIGVVWKLTLLEKSDTYTNWIFSMKGSNFFYRRNYLVCVINLMFRELLRWLKWKSLKRCNFPCFSRLVRTRLKAKTNDTCFEISTLSRLWRKQVKIVEAVTWGNILTQYIFLLD